MVAVAVYTFFFINVLCHSNKTIFGESYNCHEKKLNSSSWKIQPQFLHLSMENVTSTILKKTLFTF